MTMGFLDTVTEFFWGRDTESPREVYVVKEGGPKGY